MNVRVIRVPWQLFHIAVPKRLYSNQKLPSKYTEIGAAACLVFSFLAAKYFFYYKKWKRMESKEKE